MGKLIMSLKLRGGVLAPPGRTLMTTKLTVTVSERYIALVLLLLYHGDVVHAKV